MSMNKKGAEFTLSTLVAMVLLVVVLLIILAQLGIIPNVFKGLRSCEDQAGHCISKTSACAEKETYYRGFNCPEKSQICCVPDEKVRDKLDDFTDKEKDALYNAIIFTLNKDPNPIESGENLNLKVDTQYDFHISINKKLPKDKIGPCAVYVTDAREDGKKYLLENNKNTKEEIYKNLILSDKDIDWNLELGFCKPFNEHNVPDISEKKYKPSLLEVPKDLVLYVILYDSEVRDVYSKLILANIKFASNLMNVNTPGPDDMVQLQANLSQMISNTQHWLAYRAYRLNVEPVVKVSGMSGAWVDKDQITLSCTEGTCTNFGVKLVKSETGNYTEMLQECVNPKEQDEFQYNLHYISGTTLKTTGIPLNLDIGGFRIPTSKQKVMYITNQKPITVVKNKAEITIDKATMINNFYANSKRPKKDSLFIGDSTYLCVNATMEDGKNVYGLSETPLRVDILPPYIDQEKDITVIYPDPVEGILPGANNYQYNYHYNRYPRVLVTQCYDFGQSGCSNFDYYTHTGNFVNLQSYTADLDTAIKAFALTEGLNMLFSYWSSKNPLNTVCPYIHSNYYRQNTQQEIRFTGQGQGIMCLRIGDKVGNAELYWKELWTPNELFKQILVEEAGKLI
ncbi:MAG: hypothetical protein KKF46_06485 [Nanoarchaeota archaeon]|nr:hypothetical protein [Nanoarchaeota archaeon]MBU1321976.1 hypothetical protein [Nanoarchaeota archaeon]MBU1598212.1 hypothetical protein [Nanoarchaeota archaeon]MBU2441117.1 hypothetical protein [Nanoarchaeota archaeon]